MTRIIEPHIGEIRKQIADARKSFTRIDLADLKKAWEEANDASIEAEKVQGLISRRIAAIEEADQAEKDQLRNSIEWQKQRLAELEAEASAKGVEVGSQREKLEEEHKDDSEHDSPTD